MTEGGVRGEEVVEGVTRVVEVVAGTGEVGGTGVGTKTGSVLL